MAEKHQITDADIARLPAPPALLRLIEEEEARRHKQNQIKELEENAERIKNACSTFPGFVREAWKVLEPITPYKHNWHIDAICEHLQAVTDGHINRLRINVPPGSSKSLLTSVFWNAYEWGPVGKPALRYLSTSFNDTPVKRDTRKTRDLIRSDWFQMLWPTVRLIRAGEMSFANNHTGTREGVAFGSLTSQRGDRLIIDDPHSTETAESEAERETTTRQFREGAQNRLNDQKNSAIVLIMQRLHEVDVSGVIDQYGMDYVNLILPMEFEPERRCYTLIGFEDPRDADGELLDPNRFPRDEVEKLKRDMGSYAYAGQYQQVPAPREGGLFKRAWFEGKIVKAAPEHTTWVRHWDLASTKRKTAARTAGVKLGRTLDGRYVVGHVVKGQEEGAAVRKMIKSTAELDGTPTMISLPQDPGQAGKVQVQDMIAMLAGYVVKAQPETGDKVTRAEPFAAQCEAGNVTLVEGIWNTDYIDELCTFPSGKFADQVDASSGAFGRLQQHKKIGKVATTAPQLIET